MDIANLNNLIIMKTNQENDDGFPLETEGPLSEKDEQIKVVLKNRKLQKKDWEEWNRTRIKLEKLKRDTCYLYNHYSELDSL